MSQLPPAPPPPIAPMPQAYGQPAPQKTNVPAIISLVCGIVGCVPFITSIAAIIFGIVGLSKAKSPQTGGKAIAIIGLILGIIGLGTWGLFSGSIFALVKGTEAQREVARQFTLDLSEGKVDAAIAQTDGTIDPDDFKALAETVQSWGKLTDLTTASFNVDFAAGRTDLAGLATFEKTSKTFQMVLVKSGSDWKVSGVEYK